MATKKERWWNNNWVVTVGGGIALFLIIDVFIKQNLLGSGLKWILSFINTEYSLPLWVLSAMVVGTALMVLVVVSAANSEAKPSLNGQVNTPQPDWINYRSDTFGTSLLYKWNYEFYGNRVEIENIAVHCDTDKCQLISGRCPICYTYYGTVMSEQEVKVRIQHKAENKLWKP